MIQRHYFVLFLLMVAMASFPLLAEEDNSVPKVDINVASENQLAQIPCIDSQLAKAIVSYREKVGGFVLFEELLQVEGFNRDLFLKVKSYLYLNGMPGEDCGC